MDTLNKHETDLRPIGLLRWAGELRSRIGQPSGGVLLGWEREGVPCQWVAGAGGCGAAGGWVEER